MIVRFPAQFAWLRAGLLLTATACAPLLDDPDLRDEPAVEGAEEALGFGLGLPLFIPPAACSNTAVWVGPSGMRGCPLISAAPTGSFRAEALFDLDSPPELRRACLYEWTPTALFANPDLAFLASQLSNYGQPAPELDCPVVSALGAPEPIPGVVWMALEQQTMTQAARPAAPYRVKAAVRVAILDTAALPYTSRDDFDNYGHGRVIGRLIDNLACPPSMAGTCAVRLENALALPLLKSRVRDEVHGGMFGTRTQLARAIYRTLFAWGKQRAVAGSSAEHLLLNLSVGWDPSHGGASGVEASMNPASRVVFQALKRASCLGAANVAAAGNADPGSRDGAMLPGGWQSVAMPTRAACSAYLGLPMDAALLADVLPTRTSYATLVTAAGAVDQADAALKLTRRSSTPHLVAYGLNAVTSDPRSGHTMSLTGTSVSTAIISAALATVWSIYPELSAGDALALVYGSAVPLNDAYGRPRPAELVLRGSSLTTKRVSICDAARLAMCSRDGCAPGFSCSAPAAGAGWLSAGPALVRNPAAPVLAAETCSDGSCVTNAPYVRAPWVGPQPGRPGCPSCVVDRLNSQVRLTLPAAGTIRALAVELDGASYRVARPSTGYPVELSVNAGAARSTSRANLLIEAEDETGRSVRSEPLSVY